MTERNKDIVAGLLLTAALLSLLLVGWLVLRLNVPPALENPTFHRI